MKAFDKNLLLKAALVTLFLLTLSYFSYQQIQSITQHPKEKQTSTIETQEESQGYPVRLKIPRINIDAAIERVGLTSKGEMAVPNSIINVGWLELGPRPGEIGSAVIDGHFNGQNGEPGVFANLDKLKEGDKLYIEDDKGNSIIFTVRKIQTYEPGYADEVFAQSEIAHLNLITCDGIWNEIKKSYSKRLVVFADIEY